MSISLTRCLEPDALVAGALRSLAGQKRVSAEVLIFDQRPSPDLARLAQRLSNHRISFRYQAIPARGLSFARNQAIAGSKTDILAFIDPDGVARPDWAVSLKGIFDHQDAGIVGGRILPRWYRPPLVITRSRWVWEQYSLFDLGDQSCPADKVIGTGFALDKSRLGAEARFDESLGRRDSRLLGGEEIDLCRRAANIGVATWYCGAAVVEHQIPPERIRYPWILKRIYYTGYNRGVSGGPAQATHALGAWDYVIVPLLLPVYLAGRITARRERSQ